MKTALMAEDFNNNFLSPSGFKYKGIKKAAG